MFEAVIFDKDGTLVDFHRTWDGAVLHGLRVAADGDAAALQQAATVLGFDLETERITPGSPLIAESNDAIYALVEPILDPDVLFEASFAASVETVAAADGLPDALHDLRARDVQLAVATNDYESVVDRQLAVLGWSDLFADRVGADSGFGAKPDPGMILGVLARLGVEPSRAVMVGDTAHDLHAGNAAGVTTVLVTNGATVDPALSGLADVVIRDLSELVAAVDIADA